MRKVLFTAIIILALCFASGAQAAPGDSADDPIFISTPAELDNVRQGLNKFYKLSNDIDLTDYLAPGGAGYVKWGTAGWEPIGDPSSAPFIGGFNGGAHKIVGLWIDRSSFIGLFANTSDATIENLGVEIAAIGIKGSYNVGGLVGFQTNSSIKNCYVAGNISGFDTVGGLVGFQTNSSIENCYATGNISSDGDAASNGGLVGSQSGGSIVASYATGDVIGAGNVGGLVGYQRSNCSIEDSYTTGNVTTSSTGSVGGLVGAQEGTSSSSSDITNCYTTGSVSGSVRSNAGGLVGSKNIGSVTNCYATGSVSGGGSVGGLMGSQSEGSIVASYATGDVIGVNDVGGLVGSLYYGATITSCYATGNVTTTISNGSVGGLVGNIDGNSNIANCYATGNVTATSGGNYTSRAGIGGLVGIINSSNVIITNCYAIGSVSGGFYAGGLLGSQIGLTSLSTFTNCFAVGNVTVTNIDRSVGGLVGHQSNCRINNCYRYAGQMLNSAVIPTASNDVNGVHGGVKTSTELMTKSTYTGNSWLFNDSVPAAGPWYWDTRGFPKLNMGTENFPFPWGQTTTPAITISVQPAANTTFNVGYISGSLSVSASVTGGGSLSYQWYSNTTNSNTGGTIIPSATGANFPIPTTLTVGTYYYYCVVSATGAQPVSSNAAAVNVTTGSTTPVISIETHPTDATVTLGSITGALFVSARVSNGSELSYQWYYSPTNSYDQGGMISNATNASLRLGIDVTPSELKTYYYFCEVRSPGAVSVRSNIAAVTVISGSTPTIIINTHPANTTVTVGNITGSLSVSASVTGGGPLSYQWYSNTTNSNTGGTLITGATNASYAIPTNLTAGVYYYYCIVSAPNVPSALSNAAMVTAGTQTSAAITINTHPVNVTVMEGNISRSLSVSASVTGGGSLSYQWYSNTTNSNTGGTLITGAEGASFPIPPNLTVGVYYFYCVVSSSGMQSVSSNAAVVTVIEESEVPVMGVTVTPESAVLSVGSSRILIANVIPEDATIKDVFWSSNNESVALVSTNGLVTAIGEGAAIITVTTVDGGFMANCEISAIQSGPITITLTPTYPADRKDVAEKTGIPENDLNSSRGMLYQSQRLASQVAKDLIRADTIHINVLPVISAQFSSYGQTAAIAIPVKGRELQVVFPFEVNLVGMTSMNMGKLFKYVSSPSEYGEKCFTILYNGSMNFGEIEPNGDYEILVFIRDGGEFDLDGRDNGEITASVFIANGNMKSDGGGGGCAAIEFGYLALALLGVMPLLKKGYRG